MLERGRRARRAGGSGPAQHQRHRARRGLSHRAACPGAALARRSGHPQRCPARRRHRGRGHPLPARWPAGAAGTGGPGARPAARRHRRGPQSRAGGALMPLLAIAALALGTYAYRLAGPAFRQRLRIPDRLQRLLSVAAAVLLTALVATAALTEGHGFAGWARPAGVLVGGVLAIRRVPFPVVIIAAVATTALLRLSGVP